MSDILTYVCDISLSLLLSRLQTRDPWLQTRDPWESSSRPTTSPRFSLSLPRTHPPPIRLWLSTPDFPLTILGSIYGVVPCSDLILRFLPFSSLPRVFTFLLTIFIKNFLKHSKQLSQVDNYRIPHYNFPLSLFHVTEWKTKWRY